MISPGNQASRPIPLHRRKPVPTVEADPGFPHGSSPWAEGPRDSEKGASAESSEWFYAQVQDEHSWGVAWTDVIAGGMTPRAAAEKAFNRIEEIFAKYPIGQSR